MKQSMSPLPTKPLYRRVQNDEIELDFAKLGPYLDEEVEEEDDGLVSPFFMYGVSMNEHLKQLEKLPMKSREGSIQTVPSAVGSPTVFYVGDDKNSNCSGMVRLI